MKNTNKKLLAVGSAFTVLLMAAQAAQARGIHDIRTDASAKVNSNGASMAETDSGFNFSKKQPRKKYLAHKKKKTSKSKRSKDRTTSNLWMFEGKNT